LDEISRFDKNQLNFENCRTTVEGLPSAKFRPTLLSMHAGLRISLHVHAYPHTERRPAPMAPLCDSG